MQEIIEFWYILFRKIIKEMYINKLLLFIGNTVKQF